MNISHLSAISLAVAVLALAYANPSAAGGKTCDPGDTRPKCQPEPPADETKFTVTLDGAFVVNASTTSVGSPPDLRGDNVITIDAPDGACSAMVDGSLDHKACETWSNVWDVCGIYDLLGNNPFNPESLEITVDRKGNPEWQVHNYEGGVRIFFATTILSHISPDPLDVTLQLNSNCVYDQAIFPGRDLCGPFLPVVSGAAGSTTFTMNHFSNHARGKKGVAHAQVCHAKEGGLLPLNSTLTITKQ